jgi:hypothetical protein
VTPNSIVFIVMDSCRYDTMMAARRPNIDRLGAIEKRYSYASWTAPSHYAFTMGMLPHTSPRDVFASEVYKEEFQQWKTRTGAGDLSFKDFLPDISLPKVLSKLGYHTVAKVSMPVLNKYTLISRDFDEYKLMPHHNDFAGMVEEIEFPKTSSATTSSISARRTIRTCFQAPTCRTSRESTAPSSRWPTRSVRKPGPTSRSARSS